MRDYENIMKRIGIKNVFLENTFEGIAIKSEPGNKWTAKKSGGLEYPLAGSADLVGDTLREANEITEAAYSNY